MSDLDVAVLRSTLDLLILKALTWGPRHGYAVAEWIASVSDRALLLEEGTLYPALHRLERKRLVTTEWGLSENNRRAKYYRLSPEGRAQLRTESRSWLRYVEAVARALRASSPEPAR